MNHQYIGPREDTVAALLEAAAPGFAFLSDGGSHLEE